MNDPRFARRRLRRPSTRQRARQFRDRYALDAEQIHLAFMNEELSAIEEQL